MRGDEFEEEDEGQAAPIPKLVPEYPPPPTDGPIQGDLRLNAHRLRRVASAVVAWAPVDAALKAHGSNMTYRNICLLAQDASDLYWAWAKEVLDIAMAVPMANAANNLHHIATDVEHRDRFKALSLFLKTHDAEFAETKKIEVSTKGTVEHRHVTQMASNLLTSGEMDTPQLAARLREARSNRNAEPEPIEAEFEEIEEPEPERDFHPAFKRGK